jgi:hypothetical protein
MIQKTYGVHVWGFVIDPRGDASYVFGAGDEFKEMRAAHLYALTDQCKDQEHIFGCDPFYLFDKRENTNIAVGTSS